MKVKFQRYRRKGWIEMRPYELFEDMRGISVSKGDYPADDKGMIARNPDNHEDQWYIARADFEKHYELEDQKPAQKRTQQVIEITVKSGPAPRLHVRMFW